MKSKPAYVEVVIYLNTTKVTSLATIPYRLMVKPRVVAEAHFQSAILNAKANLGL